MFYDCPVCGEENEATVTTEVNPTYDEYSETFAHIELGDFCKCELSEEQESALIQRYFDRGYDMDWD